MSKDCELRLSVAGGSGCNASCVLECPYMHFLKYEQGWRLKKMPKHFALGIGVHDEFFSKCPGRFREMWEGGRIFDDDDSEGWPIDRDEDGVEADIELAERMLTALGKEKIVIAKGEDGKPNAERTLTTTIMNPETGETPAHLEGVIISGRRDMIEEIRGGEQHADLKTSARSWPETQKLGMIQLPTYRYLEACNGDPVHDKGDYIVVTKTKVAKVQRHSIEMGANDFFAVYDHFKSSAEKILDCRKEGHWPKYRHNCLQKFMQLCEYHALCFPERYPNPEDLVNERLQRRK